MDVVDLPLEQIIPYARNPRRNEQAIATVAASIQEFGWRQPIVVDEAMVVLAGHTRLEAARKLGFKTAPVHIAKGLTANQARAFRIMDNRSSENAEWDKDLLNLELADLLEADFDLGLTGFTDDELNALMSSLEDGTGPQEGEDDVPETPEDPISRPGDLWILGNHRLLCGDSTVATDVVRLLGHDLLQIACLTAQFLDVARRRRTGGVARKALLPSFEELLGPAVIQALGYDLSAAQLCNAVLAPQAVQNDPDLLLGGILFAGRTADVLDDLLAAALLGSGGLSHLHSLAVTMGQKPSLIKST